MAIHFCGGKITSVQILPFVPKEDPCGCDGTAVPVDCCKTEIKTIQLNDEQIAVHVNQPSSPQTAVTLWAETSIEIALSSHAIREVVPASSPPDSPPLYILHSVFLI
ncbi:MAG: hypothetical protein ABSA44_01420 [Bacteroidota bacterium]